jgi:hypothetical protein
MCVIQPSLADQQADRECLTRYPSIEKPVPAKVLTFPIGDYRGLEVKSGPATSALPNGATFGYAY